MACMTDCSRSDLGLASAPWIPGFLEDVGYQAPLSGGLHAVYFVSKPCLATLWLAAPCLLAWAAVGVGSASATCIAGPLRVVLGAQGAAPCMLLVDAVDSAGGALGQQIDCDNWVGTGI